MVENKYSITHLLAKGQFGFVYEAFDINSSSNDTVVIKFTQNH